jgi:hypothetical protein
VSRSSASGRPLWACLALALLGQCAFSQAFAFPVLAIPGLACFGVAGWLLSRQEPKPFKAWKPGTWAEFGILAAILALGLALRLYRLDSLPDGGFRDEGQSGIVAAHMLNGEAVYDTGTDTPLFLILVPAGYFYPMALCFKWLGVSLYGVRLDSVIFGMLSLAAFYFLARRLLGVGLGLLLAFCLATLRWHINFSRIGLLGIMTFFIQIPFAYFLVLAFQKPETWPLKKLSTPLTVLALALAIARVFLNRLLGGPLGDWEWLAGLMLDLPAVACMALAAKDLRSRVLILAAALLGLSFYTYAAAYLLVLLALGWVFYAWRRNPGLKSWPKTLALAAMSFLVFSGPMLDYYFSHSERVNGRPNRISIFQHDIPGRDPSAAHAFCLNLVKTMGMVNVRGDNNPRHNLPNAPMLNFAWAAAFALGLALALWQISEPLPFLLLLWWQATLLGGYFSIEAPQAYRSMDSIAPVLLLMGLGIQRLWALIRSRVDPWIAGPSLIFLFFVLGAGLEGYLYFGRQTALPEHWSAFSGDESEMGRDFKALSPGTHALVRPDWKDSYAFKFMAYPYDDYDAFDPSQDIPLKRMDSYRGKNVLYILDQDYLPLADVMKAYYPLGQYREVRHPSSGEFLYWTYYVPASETQNAILPKGGLTGRYYSDPGSWGSDWKAPHWQQANLKLTRRDPFVLFHWTVAPIVERFYSVQWSGRIKAPKTGPYDLSAFSDDYAELEIDGKKIAESPQQPSPGGWIEGKINLMKGQHTIRLRYYESKNTAHVELWWTPPGAAEKHLVPTEALLPQ